MAKKKLNKGLNEIFGDNIDDFIDNINGSASPESGKLSLNIDEIRPNPYQPRKEFDNEALKELSESIKENGIIQPVIVRKAIGGYELVAGERRLRASKLAGLNKIPAIIREFDDKQMMEISLLENIQRKDLTAIEEALAYEQLIKKLKYTQEQLGKRIGKSRANVTNTLRLLNLPDEVKEMVSNNKLSGGHARTLLALSDEKRIIELAKKCVNDGISVRQLEVMVKEPSSSISKTNTKPKTKKNPFIEDVKTRMQKKLDTKVDISNKAIIIHYNGTKDLNRILETIKMLDD